MQQLDRWLASVAAAGVALLALAALATGVDILTRRTLSLGFVGLVDLTQWLVMGAAFACIPLTFLRQAQIEVDFATSRWSPHRRATLRAVSAAAAAVWMAVIAFASARALLQALAQGDRSATLAWPMALYWLPVVLGSALAALACAALARSQWRRSRQAA